MIDEGSDNPADTEDEVYVPDEKFLHILTRNKRRRKTIVDSASIRVPQKKENPPKGKKLKESRREARKKIETSILKDLNNFPSNERSSHDLETASALQKMHNDLQIVKGDVAFIRKFLQEGKRNKEERRTMNDQRTNKEQTMKIEYIIDEASNVYGGTTSSCFGDQLHLSSTHNVNVCKDSPVFLDIEHNLKEFPNTDELLESSNDKESSMYLFNKGDENVEEILPGSKVYMKKTCKGSAIRHSSTPTSLARSLLALVYRKESLISCSLFGKVWKGHRGEPGTGRPGLQREGVEAIIGLVHEVAFKRGWTNVRNQDLVKAMGTRLSEFRSGKQ